MAAHHNRVATRTYFERVQLYQTSTDMTTNVAFTTPAGGALSLAGSTLQYEIYMLHIYVADTTTVSILDASGGNVVWAMVVPQYDSEWPFPLASPLLLGENTKPWVKTSTAQNPTTIYGYGAIRPVN